MSWEKTHKITVTNVDQTKIWKIWENVNEWHTWDSDIEYAKLDGKFVTGNKFTLKPKSGPKVKITLLEVEPERSFTDVTSFPLAKMYSIHEMRKTRDGVEITHTVKVNGPLSFLWKKVVAEKVAAGLEEQAKNMIQKAKELS